jgi:rSAM/selenodomain-associated transferase 1
LSTALIVFAKAPVAGLAKTRLIPALGASGAAALAERLLVHAVEAAVAAGFDAVELCTTLDTGHPLFRQLQQRHGLELSAQGDGDLGARMQRALARALLQHDRALLIGSDVPGLDAVCLRQADAALAAHDAVFVPALDGGYALVGLRRPAPQLFEGMRWSTPQVMQHTRQRAVASGLRVAELCSLPDIDEPADLVHLPPGWLRRMAAACAALQACGRSTGKAY